MVIILTGRGKFQGIFAKLCCQLLKILTGVLTWTSRLDRSFDDFEPLDRRRLDRLQELEPDDWKWVCFFEFLVDLAAESVH